MPHWFVAHRRTLASLTIQPSANLPDESITPISTVAKTGVYYGYAQVLPPRNGNSELCPEDYKVLPMVMSLGWNPFYKNEQLTAVRPLFVTWLLSFADAKAY